MADVSSARTEVAIVGAGPAGLLLAHLLAADGVESIVVESRSEEYVASRIRAGILEQSTVDLLREVGLADRLEREGVEKFSDSYNGAVETIEVKRRTLAP